MNSRTRKLVRRNFGALLLIALAAVPSTKPQTEATPRTETPVPEANAQKSAVPSAHSLEGIAFWDLPDRSMTAMLATAPSKEEERYNRLRHYFIALGCSGKDLSDLLLQKNGRHPILLCTLPGATDSRIVVTAWMPHGDLYNGASDGWPEAVMLPMLYHAIRAQPRQATFVFAELSGDHGDKDFQDQLEAGGRAAPLALVSVTALGFGPPGFSNLPANVLSPAVRAHANTLQDEAWRMIRLEHIDTTQASISSPFSSSPMVTFGLVRNGPKDIPRILVYSSPVVLPGKRPAVTLPAFHQNHDFLAFYLCDLDKKLTTPPAQ